MNKCFGDLVKISPSHQPLLMKKPQINYQKTFSDGISLLHSHDAYVRALSVVGDINEYKYL